jgi:RNA polymerase sigma-70 factor (ECF subfamily)
MQKPSSPKDETSLWRGIKNDDQACFEEVYNRFLQNLVGYGRKICSNRDVVNDAIHDVFLDIWKYRKNLSETTSIKFYLFSALRHRIIKNDAKDFESTIFNFRDEELFIKHVFSHEEKLIDGEVINEKVAFLKRNLSHLSPRQYEALVLRFYEDFSYEEIATMLKVNEQSARNLVQRGLEHLRSFTKAITSIFLLGTILGS